MVPSDSFDSTAYRLQGEGSIVGAVPGVAEDLDPVVLPEGVRVRGFGVSAPGDGITGVVNRGQGQRQVEGYDRLMIRVMQRKSG